MYQPGKVGNPARGQLNREIFSEVSTVNRRLVTAVVSIGEARLTDVLVDMSGSQRESVPAKASRRSAGSRDRS